MMKNFVGLISLIVLVAYSTFSNAMDCYQSARCLNEECSVEVCIEGECKIANDTKEIWFDRSSNEVVKSENDERVSWDDLDVAPSDELFVSNSGEGQLSCNL